MSNNPYLPVRLDEDDGESDMVYDEFGLKEEGGGDADIEMASTKRKIISNEQKSNRKEVSIQSDAVSKCSCNYR